MLWLNPVALFALAAVAAPILIHILVQRRAERLAFPTLRFLQPTRLASIRRHVLEDLPLLAVRAGLLAAAAAALAGPLFVTTARRQAWDRRIVRAVVVAAAPASQAGVGASVTGGGEGVVLQRRFEAVSLSHGIRRAVRWLDTAPPARREIVIASPFPIGSVTQSDVAAIPAGIGVRFERSGSLPATRMAPAGRLLTPTTVRAREVTLTGSQTSFRDLDVGVPSVWPVDVVSAKDDQAAIAAAIAAALSQRVRAAAPDRRARMVLVRTAALPDAVVSPSPIQQPWMAAAVIRVAADTDLDAAGARVSAGLIDARFTAAPWQMLASAADGRPLAAAAGSPDGLLVASAAPATDVATPVLLRAIANALADVPDLHDAELVPIADEVLRRWSRPSAPPVSPRIETVDRDDRRWLWIVVLVLLSIETWMRRQRPAHLDSADREERARVA
ncbi:MAG: BatA domain-containing protein [Vicinamibacterales bacterium]